MENHHRADTNADDQKRINNRPDDDFKFLFIHLDISRLSLYELGQIVSTIWNEKRGPMALFFDILLKNFFNTSGFTR